MSGTVAGLDPAAGESITRHRGGIGPLLLIEGACAAVIAAFMATGSLPVAGIVAGVAVGIVALLLLCPQR